jgi:hypothetical protein
MATVTITSSQNLTSVVYAADDDLVINQGVTLTITATPANRIRSITGLFPTSKLQVTNTSTANMLRIGFMPNNTGAAVSALRFENGAVCQMDGNWITIYTGTGASNQTVLANLNSVGGQLLDYLPGVEVETGSGTGIYKKWVVLPKAVTNFTRSPYGFNSPNYTTGTVSVSAAGAVTGTGTGWDTSSTNKRFRAAGQAQDYLVSAYTSATAITILNPDGTTYSGPTIAAGATYVIKNGSAYEAAELGSGAESGTALWYDPLTSAITCGDGTNGLVIPNGAKVRIPNIFVTSDTPSTTLSAAITGTTAAAISLTDGTFFSTNAGAYSDTTVVGSLLIIDSTSGESERIGYTSRTGNTISATGMVRGAFYTAARTHANGSVVKFIAPNNHYTAPCLDLQTGGSLICTNVIWGMRFALVQTSAGAGFYASRKVYFEKCFLTQSIVSQNFGPTESFTLKNSIVNKSPDCALNSTSVLAWGMQNSSGTAAVSDVFINMDNSRGTANVVTCGLVVGNNAFVQEFTNIKVWGHRNHSGTGYCLYANNLKNLNVDSLYTTGQLILLDTADCTFSNLYQASGCLDPNFGCLSGTELNIATNCFRNVFRGIKNYDNLRPPRQYIVSTSTLSSNNIFHNFGVAAYDLKNWGISTLINNSSKNSTFAYISASSGRSGNNPVASNNLGYGTRLIKIRDLNWNTSMLGQSGAFIPYGGYCDQIPGPQPGCGTQSNFDIQPFTVCDDSSTATGGFLCCGPFLPEQNFSPYVSGLSATAYLTGTNEIAPTTNGDQVTISSVYAMKGISQFNTAGTITYGGSSSTTGLTYEFKMANWGDALPAGWTALTLANLESARAALSGYSTSVGINIQMRITATTTVSGRRVYIVRMPIVLDTSYTPTVGTFDLNVTGVLTGSMVAVSTDSGTTWPSAYKQAATGSTVTIPIDSNFTGSTTSLKVRVRKAGYQVLEYDLTTVDQDVDLPIEQVQVVDIDGVAVYGRGSGTTSSFIAIVPGSLRVDIGNTLVEGEDLYDVCAGYQATATGIAYPEILQFDGTDSIILNSWKLRRNVAGSTNAMIDMIVKYGPSVITNPVDEANGSVQLFPRTVRQGSLGAIAATVWDYQTSSATTSGSMGERLKDASTVATNGQQLTAALS